MGQRRVDRGRVLALLREHPPQDDLSAFLGGLALERDPKRAEGARGLVATLEDESLTGRERSYRLVDALISLSVTTRDWSDDELHRVMLVARQRAGESEDPNVAAIEERLEAHLEWRRVRGAIQMAFWAPLLVEYVMDLSAPPIRHIEHLAALTQQHPSNFNRGVLNMLANDLQVQAPVVAKLVNPALRQLDLMCGARVLEELGLADE